MRPMPASPEVRVYPVELVGEEREGEERYIYGTAVPYNTWTDVGPFTERFAPGAFTRSIRNTRGLPLLLWHDAASWPIGVAEEWSETETGLSALWRLNMKSERGREAYQHVTDGFMRFLSVGFQLSEGASKVESNTGGGNPRITHKEGRLLETSLVNVPAYADAAITHVRSLQAEHVARPQAQMWERYRDRLKTPQN